MRGTVNAPTGLRLRSRFEGATTGGIIRRPVVDRFNSPLVFFALTTATTFLAQVLRLDRIGVAGELQNIRDIEKLHHLVEIPFQPRGLDRRFIPNFMMQMRRAGRAMADVTREDRQIIFHVPIVARREAVEH